MTTTNPDAVEGVQHALARLRHYPEDLLPEMREHIAQVIERLSAKFKEADAQNKELKLLYRSALEVMGRVREVLQNIAADIEDEGKFAIISRSRWNAMLKEAAKRIRAIPRVNP